MKKPLRLWASLSLILVSMIVVTTSLFYGIMLHDTHQSIKNQETHLLTSTGKMLASHQAIEELLLNNQMLKQQPIPTPLPPSITLIMWS